MDNAGYVSLSRQSGLKRELNSIANNIANINTTGFRREGVVFSEHVKRLDSGDPSVSIASAGHHYIDMTPGEIRLTGNPLDFAIEGEGFFTIEGPDGPRLTRAGAFTLNAEGELVTQDGARVLDDGGGAIVFPPNAVGLAGAQDGTLSANGQVVGRLGVVTVDPLSLSRVGGNLFATNAGVEPLEAFSVRQGAIESSNVSAVAEIAHMIEVQRTYEMGQKFLQSDDERTTRMIRAVAQA